MSFDDFLGRTATLRIRRFGPEGAFLEDPEETRAPPPLLLLPGAEIPEGAHEGDVLQTFVYLDSEARPIATLRAPLVELGEVAFLEVTDLTDFGAFVDWGMPKELLVPFAEQTRDLRPGDRHPIGLYIDKSGRLAGTMRVSEMLRDTGDFADDEWVEGVAWREEPGLGFFIIVERRFVGLLPASEPHSLVRGDAAKFRVANVLPDEKIELSLRRHAHEEVDDDARKILELVSRAGAPKVGDHSKPEQIRALFGLSKKAFKRAAGKLLREGSAHIDRDGFLAKGGRTNDAAPRVSPTKSHSGSGPSPRKRP